MVAMFLRLCSYLAAIASCAVMLLWLVGILASDRFLVTQFIAWMPTWMLLAVTVPLLVVWFTLALAVQYLESRKTIVPNRVPASRRRPGRWPARVALVLSAAATVWLVFIETRLLNRLQVPKRSQGVNLTFWNADGAVDDQIVANLIGSGPDLVVLANAGSVPNLPDIVDALSLQGSQATVLRDDRFLIVSRYPITRWSGVSLEIPGPERQYIRWQQGHVDAGRALLIEIDAFPLLSEKIVIWALDLPSDPNLPRWEVARHVHQRLQRVASIGHVRQRDGTFAQEKLAGGFPLPDLVVGDLNIPRGAASLGLIAEGMTHAFDQAGWGLKGTFPRQQPLMHVDHLFVGPDFEATRYRVYDGGSGRHRFIAARIASSKPPPPGAEPVKPPASTPQDSARPSAADSAPVLVAPR
jgi:hypothetical protein